MSLADYQLGWDAAATAYKADVERLTREAASDRVNIEALREEKSRLRTGVERLERENGELIDENDRLRAALKKYGDPSGSTAEDITSAAAGGIEAPSPPQGVGGID